MGNNNEARKYSKISSLYEINIKAFQFLSKKLRSLAVLAIFTFPIALFRNKLVSKQTLIPIHVRHLSSLSTMSYEKELHIALLAVQRATLLTQHVFHEKEKGTSSKEDKSPVTVGDYGAQALVIHAIRKNFPEDEIVAEEDSVSLREQRPLVDQIWGLVKETKLKDQKAEEELGGPIGDVEAMLTAIDAGSSPGGSDRKSVV